MGEISEDNVKAILEYNDEDDHNLNLATLSGIFGKAYEVLYVIEHHITKKPIVRMTTVTPLEMGLIYDNSLQPELLGAIRYYQRTEDDKLITYVDVYDNERITRYKYTEGALSLVAEWEHYFNDVPVVKYENNSFEMADIEEDILTLNDAYNILTSDSVNDMEEFVNAYLILKGFGGTDETQLAMMKENRVLLMEQGDSGEWLERNINDQAEANRIKRTENSIHKMASVPDLTDEKFGSNLSGVAIAYKLWGLEQKAVIKERKFKKGLQRRLELIFNYLAVQGIAYDYAQIGITFTRNMPMNAAEETEMFTKMGGIMSLRTALEHFPLVENAEEELDRIKEEQGEIKLENEMIEE